MFPRPSERRAAVPLHLIDQEGEHGERHEDVRQVVLAMAEVVLEAATLPRPGAWNVSFSIAHLRRPHRMTDITVSRTGGRSVTHENLRILPFVSVSSYPGMSVFRPKFASSAGRPRSRSKRCTMPVFPSRLSHVSFVPLASNQPDGGPWSPGFAPRMKRKPFSAHAA